MRRVVGLLTLLLVSTGCVYFNDMYDTERAYDEAVDRRRDGRDGEARTAYDSVIAKARRIVRDHPESSHAARAALLKARAEIAREQWESAAESAETARGLTTDPRRLGVAAGLQGVALRRLGEPAAAERLLTEGLASEPASEDQVQFLFHRGLARLDLENPTGAAADLEAVALEQRLTEDVRLDLARALAEAGQYDAAVQLTDALVRENRFANFGDGMDAHLDSLARWAPGPLDSAFAAQLDDETLPATKQTLLHYYRGLARESAGDVDAALGSYAVARGTGEGSRYRSEAAYRDARLRMTNAATPDDIVATRPALEAARAVPDADLAVEVARLRRNVDEFDNLVDAYETRGGTAAEAALRAAEIAGTQLGARRVARGLYLRYLELAPDSPWRAKAMAGAMVYADAPAGDWASDTGADTDRRLAAQLDALPAADPYRISLSDLPRGALADSAYADAERDLQRRLIQIRMLYDTTAAFILPSDTATVDEVPPTDGEPAENVIE